MALLLASSDLMAWGLRRCFFKEKGLIWRWDTLNWLFPIKSADGEESGDNGDEYKNNGKDLDEVFFFHIVALYPIEWSRPHILTFFVFYASFTESLFTLISRFEVIWPKIFAFLEHFCVCFAIGIWRWNTGGSLFSCSSSVCYPD